jgi:hypothetical protein
MIDIALKHFIYEACIDVVFDNIKRNFVSTINLSILERNNMIKKGRIFKYIDVFGMYPDDDTYQNRYIDCEIYYVTEYTFSFSHLNLDVYRNGVQEAVAYAEDYDMSLTFSLLDDFILTI